MDISQDQAEKIMEAAISKAQEIQVPMNIAIVDSGAHLKLFTRMDGSLLGCADIAMKKAKTARLFERDTEDIGKLAQPGGMLYNIELSNDGLISFAGGMVIMGPENQIIGAIGVSGGTVDEDRAVAYSGILAR